MRFAVSVELSNVLFTVYKIFHIHQDHNYASKQQIGAYYSPKKIFVCSSTRLELEIEDLHLDIT